MCGPESKGDFTSYNQAYREEGESCGASAKREAQAQILDMLQTRQSDLSLSQSQ